MTERFEGGAEQAPNSFEGDEWTIASAVEAADAAEEVGRRLAELGWPATAADRFETAAIEAMANGIEHGNKNDPSKNIFTLLHFTQDRAEFVVRWEGSDSDAEEKVFDKSSVPDPTAPENLMKDGGRGIFLMSEGCDEGYPYFFKGGVQLIKTLAPEEDGSSSEGEDVPVEETA